MEADNYEVKIYTETARQIFKKCFEKAHIQENEKLWSKILWGKITDEIPKNNLSSKYLSNKYLEIKNATGQVESFKKIAFFHIMLQPLSQYAGINDYKFFNKQFGPGIPVYYRSKPFNRFDFLRIIFEGIVLKEGFDWVYTDEYENQILTGTVKAVNTCCMPHDNDPLWLEVISLKPNGTEQKIYFAERNNTFPIQLVRPERLLDFFTKLLKTD